MISFEKTVYTDRPWQEVFDMVSDRASDAPYRSGARFSEWSSKGPVGVGSTIRTVSRLIGRTLRRLPRSRSAIRRRSTPSRLWAGHSLPGSRWRSNQLATVRN